MAMMICMLVLMTVFLVVWLYVRKHPEQWKRLKLYIENCKESTVYMVLFFGTILSQVPTILNRLYPTSADEVYTIANAMFFAGNDVSAYMHMKFFYNFGYTIFMAPLYKLFEEPVYVFRAMLFCNAILHGIIVVITYYIARNKLKLSKFVAIAFTLVSSANVLILYFRGFIYNEMPLALICWLTILILMQLVDSSLKKKIGLSVLLGILMAYAYSVHSRCLIVYLALALVVVLYLLVYRKLLVEIISFVVGFVPVYWVGQKLLAYVQEHVYLKEAGEALTNSVEKVASGTDKFAIFTSGEGILKVIAQFFSLSGAMTLETAGFLTLATVVVLYYAVKNLKRLCTGKENRNVFILGMFSTLSLWGMIAAISIVGAVNGKVRFLYYSRYFVPFIAPFLLVALYLMKREYKRMSKKWIGIWSGLITIGVILVYARYSYPILEGTGLRAITSTAFFMPFRLYAGQGNFSKSVIAIALAALVVFTCILMYLYCKKQLLAVCTVIMLFSCGLGFLVEQMQTLPASNRRYQATNTIHEICDETDLLEDKRILCVSLQSFGRAMFFSMCDEEIIYDKKQYVFDEDTVVVGSALNKVASYNPEYIYQLDNNEWIGMWDEELSEEFADEYELCIQQ